MSEISGRLKIPTEIPFDYVLREAEGAPRELILLLHGYAHTGRRIFEKLESVLPQDSVVLAPNAPFAFAVEKEEGVYRLGCAWYLYSQRTDEYVIDMAPALQFVQGAIEKMGYGALPLRIIGFSQGGYFAPVLGETLPQTKQVIALHSTYLHEELGPELRFRTDNIVGSEDDVVDPVNSEKSHRIVLGRSRGGDFFQFPVGHRIDEQVARKVGELIRQPV